mmetsp:Transcript_24990/g.57571  ORF Transcript_24990/g.57571 Transcript_24990/m.57571 type:complete len:262 (+) Transcript_24990:432-1217(+)
MMKASQDCRSSRSRSFFESRLRVSTRGAPCCTSSSRALCDPHAKKAPRFWRRRCWRASFMFVKSSAISVVWKLMSKGTICSLRIRRCRIMNNIPSISPCCLATVLPADTNEDVHTHTASCAKLSKTWRSTQLYNRDKNIRVLGSTGNQVSYTDPPSPSPPATVASEAGVVGEASAGVAALSWPGGDAELSISGVGFPASTPSPPAAAASAPPAPWPASPTALPLVVGGCSEGVGVGAGVGAGVELGVALLGAWEERWSKLG